MKRTETVPFTETETETESKTEIPFPTETACAPLRASDVVRAYVVAATEAGNTRFVDAKSKAILGAHALRLIRAEDWPPELVLRAVQKFAGTQRNPVFLDEWIRLTYSDEREQLHLARKRSEPKDGGLKSIFAVIKKASV